MNNEQEIKRLAKTLNGVIEYISYDVSTIKNEANLNIIDYVDTAKNLINAGIGDKKQAVKEAFEKLKAYKKPIVCDPEIEYVTVNIIDELFTELYGE